MDTETLSISMTSGIFGFIAKAGLDLIRAKIAQRREISPQPLATKEEPSFQLKSDCKDEHKKVDDNFKEIYNLLRDSEKRNSEWQKSIETQLGRISGSLDYLKEKKHE